MLEKLNQLTIPILLDDETIRRGLVAKLAGASNTPKAIIEELRVHNGNAIADVVAIHREAHCYEIKGVGDSIHRIKTQGRFYDLVFRKVTLVTTENHLKSGVQILPQHWGIILVTNKCGTVKFTHRRGATANPDYDKKLALLTLWRSELAKIACDISSEKLNKMNRSNLVSLIAEKTSKTKLVQLIAHQLIERSRGNQIITKRSP
jgi:hypothetical protein